MKPVRPTLYVKNVQRRTRSPSAPPTARQLREFTSLMLTRTSPTTERGESYSGSHPTNLREICDSRTAAQTKQLQLLHRHYENVAFWGTTLVTPMKD